MTDNPQRRPQRPTFKEQYAINLAKAEAKRATRNRAQASTPVDLPAIERTPIQIEQRRLLQQQVESAKTKSGRKLAQSTLDYMDRVEKDQAETRGMSRMQWARHHVTDPNNVYGGS
jgi:hypothetical protein